VGRQQQASLSFVRGMLGTFGGAQVWPAEGVRRGHLGGDASTTASMVRTGGGFVSHGLDRVTRRCTHDAAPGSTKRDYQLWREGFGWTGHAGSIVEWA
jgi:hypothetical protein